MCEQISEIDESSVTETLEDESDYNDTEPLGKSQQEITTTSIPNDSTSFDEQETTTTISINEQKESEEDVTEVEEETNDVSEPSMDQPEATDNQTQAEEETINEKDNDIIIFPTDEEERVFTTTLRSLAEDENLGFPTERIEPLEEVTEMDEDEMTTVTIIEATEAEKDLPEILSQTKDEMAEDNAISDTPRSFPESETFVQNKPDDVDTTDEAAPIESETTTGLTSDTDAITETYDATTISVPEDKTEYLEGDSTNGETTESDAKVEEPTTVSTSEDPTTKSEESPETTTESITA